MFWNPERQEKLKLLRQCGTTYVEIGKLWGVSRNAVAGAIYRHILTEHNRRPETLGCEERAKTYKTDKNWSEARLTERWVDRRKKLK